MELVTLALPGLLLAAVGLYRLGARERGNGPFLYARIALLVGILVAWTWAGGRLVSVGVPTLGWQVLVLSLSMAALIGVFGLEILRAVGRMSSASGLHGSQEGRSP